MPVDSPARVGPGPAGRRADSGPGVGRGGVAGVVLVVALAATVSAASLLTDLPRGGGGPAGRTFYVDPAGDDEADGLDGDHAWRTLQRASDQRLKPGDTVLLRGGARFAGTLRLDPADAGTLARPVTVDSFGAGRAVIAPADGPAIDLAGADGVRIRNLVLVGGPGASESADGIAAYTRDRSRRVEHLVIDHIDVSGFRIGIAIGVHGAAVGWRDVAVSDVRAHHNRDAGLLTYGPQFDLASPTYAVADLRVSRVVAFDNAGNPADAERNSGSGIVLGSVDGAGVEHSTAYRNGSACRAQEGPVGIWAFDSTRVVFRRNLSWGNLTGGDADGGGFDLDQNVSDSLMEANISHHNAGPGFMLYSTRENDAQTGNVVRFNVSVDDAPDGGIYAGISVIGRVSRARIYHNTVLAPESTAAVRVAGTPKAIAFADNLLMGRGSGQIFDLPAGKAEVSFAGDAAMPGVGTAQGSIVAGPLEVTATENWAASAVAGFELPAGSPWSGKAVPLPDGEWQAGLTDLRGTPVRQNRADPGALQKPSVN